MNIWVFICCPIGNHIFCSIGVCDVLGGSWRVVDCRERLDFDIADILVEEAPSTLLIGQLNQEVEDVICAGVPSFIVLAEAGVVLRVLEVGKTVFGIAVEILRPVLVVNLIALEPFLKPHGAHDVVVRHGVERVEGILEFLLGTQTSLEVSRGSCN